MGQDSKIEWTHHTFNPWWGCQKVSDGCTNCYALTLSKRYGYDVWGPAKTTPRRMMSEAYWKQPLKWNRAAQATGVRARVFCASMADVFEDHPQVAEWRKQLWGVIDQTPSLDWLLLTKRPQNVNGMVPWWWIGSQPGHFPDNVWIGTSCEDQRRADERIPHLLRVPAKVRFLSCEPLLGALDLSKWLAHAPALPADLPSDAQWGLSAPTNEGISWIICGGESGPGARPMHPAWARSLRDQAQAAGVAFFFKQWGDYSPDSSLRPGQDWPDSTVLLARDGTALAPGWAEAGAAPMYRVGKARAGRLLDGRAWNEFPEREAVER